MVVCGSTHATCSFGSGARGNGGGVQIAVDVMVELVVVEMVLIVDVKVIVRVAVVNLGEGKKVDVKDIVLQGTVVVDGRRVVEPELVEVYVEATAIINFDKTRSERVYLLAALGVEVIPTVTRNASVGILAGLVVGFSGSPFYL